MTRREQQSLWITGDIHECSRFASPARQWHVLNVNVVGRAESIVILARLLDELSGRRPDERLAVGRGRFPVGVGGKERFGRWRGHRGQVCNTSGPRVILYSPQQHVSGTRRV